jgi:hypothetical protein
MFALINPNSQRIGSHDIVRKLHNIGKKSGDTTIEQEVCALEVVIRSSTKLKRLISFMRYQQKKQARLVRSDINERRLHDLRSPNNEPEWKLVRRSKRSNP